MLMAVDIGNTHTKLAAFAGESLVAIERLPTDPSQAPAAAGALMCGALYRHGITERDIDGVVFCSVVPRMTDMVEQAAQERLGIAALNVKKARLRGITLSVDNPDTVGADRVVNVTAAYVLHGGPAIVVDFGTATTFDLIDGSGCFLGGVIAPGIALTSEALTARAAQLPSIEPTFPDTIIGRNADHAMRSGLMYGYLSLTEGILRRMQTETKMHARVIATGGLADQIAGRTDVIDILEPHLTLQGLRLIWDMNRPETATGG